MNTESMADEKEEIFELFLGYGICIYSIFLTLSYFTHSEVSPDIIFWECLILGVIGLIYFFHNYAPRYVKKIIFVGLLNSFLVFIIISTTINEKTSDILSLLFIIVWFGFPIIMINFGSFYLNSECLKNWAYLFFKWQDSTGIDLTSDEGVEFIREYEKNHKLHSDSKVVVDHIEHIINLVGIEYVGIGSDYDGILLSQPSDLPDVSSYPVIVYELLKRGYSENDIKKILSENFLRVWNDVIEIADSLNNL